MAFKSKLDAWLSAVIEAGWLAALVLAPLFFNVFSSRVFEPDKISLIRTIALIMAVAWLTKLANSGALWLPAYATSPNEEETENGDATSISWLSRLVHTPLLLPILLLVLAYLISTVLSVARYVSWWGSYQRLQGTYTLLSYVVIALITMGHLRQPLQIRRLQHAVILTSLPIAIYGIVQHYGIDPLPWGGDTQTRVAANAGNAIFLAAYLIMAFFFTFERVYSSFAYLLGHAEDDDEGRQDISSALAGGAYLFVLLVQLIAIFWTLSRGPWLGLMLGTYLFVLLLFSALRPKRYKAWTAIWVSLGVAGALLLVAANTLPVFSGLRSVPHIGRLTTLLESGGGTGRVRVLIWQGAAAMVSPHEPLIYPDGSTDAINPIRPLVGYGPEAMWIAYNPFYPPELAQLESRNASPDRSHNETWDSLVITGVLGFLAYLTLFVAIFYWALRWLGLLSNRRDSLLFGGLLLSCSVVFVLIFRWYDSSWRFFGVALPAGMMLGLGAYVTLAAFLHPGASVQRSELPRQLLIVTLMATFAAHFTEIHFGIAIAATRTYFWIYTALLLALGMRWAQPEAFALSGASTDTADTQEVLQRQAKSNRKANRRRQRQPRSEYSPSLPAVATTVMTDVLIFITFVYIYTTNTRHVSQTLDILFGSITRRAANGEFPRSPAILFLMLFTWFVAATIGLAVESLQHRDSPGARWWLRGYLLHALIVWSVWFIYGLLEASRMLPSQAGTDLDSQLAQVSAHFAIFTWILVAWLLTAATVYAWPWLRDQRLPSASHWIAAAATGAVVALATLFIVDSVNIALVRADTIYKQGQQFDAQGNWVSSVELYRRALNARRTEDHYMLFLGRALLEQAKKADPEGAVSLPDDATLDDVLNLAPEQVSMMGREDLLRSAEIVLKEAQRVNPLNTDHTANLARLYRAWADLSPQEQERQEMLDKSIAAYDMAVTLSPHAAHLWNEKGNSHLARGERDLAEQAYEHSLSLDDKYDQTYLLLADMYETESAFDKALAILKEGTAKLPNSVQLFSFLGVAAAREGDYEDAIDANLRVADFQPNNAGAMRNLALLYRDSQQTDLAIEWAEKYLATISPENTQDLIAAHQLTGQLYQIAGKPDQAIAHYEQIVSLDPNDTGTLTSLANLYLNKQELNRAVETLRRLSDLEPDRFEHPFAIAQILEQTGQPADALVFAEQALALANGDDRTQVEELIDEIKASN
ncbi:MAG: tetratricopeptide repeat protein [Caldilineaceae bacterium]